MEEIRYKKIQEFESMRSRTFWMALGAGVLHKAATWFGGAALTWATVVLMGGFASQLAISDFSTITLLVVLIIFLLALALLTCKLVTKKSLSTGSLHPLQLKYSDPLLAIVNGIKFISILLQCSLLIWALMISGSKIHRPYWYSLYNYAFSKPHADNEAALPSLQACLQSCATNHRVTDASALQACSEFCFPAQNSSCTVTANLQVCLLTFHSLVIATCIAVMLCNVYVFIRVAQAWWLMYLGGPKSLSSTRYHDEVLSRGLSMELVNADEFDWRDFLLRSVGEDLVVRNIAPLEVKRQNEDFIEYLFYYPKGVEMVMGMLASENSLLQQTAANMPGFWSFDPNGMEKDGMDLLSRLGEKLGLPGKVAEGAANSFKSLAIAWSGNKHSPLLKVYVSRSGGSGRESSRTPVRTSGDVISGTLAPVRSGVGGVESPNGVSRSGGEGEPTNAVSRSGGGGDGASRSSISTESINVPSPSEVAGRGCSGTSESSSEGGEGHGHSQSRAGGNGDTDSVSGGPGEGAGESMSTLPEPSNTISGSSREAAADRSSKISGVRNGGVRSGGSGGGRGDEQKWNVVQKVVDLVANKRLPTLQVYVRALDSFFMSESVKNSLTTEEREEIKSKLLKIIRGDSNRASANGAGHTIVRIDSSAKARTRLLAFSALDRLGESDDTYWVEGGEDLLGELDGHLNQVQKNFVIWFEEERRYRELCKKYSREPGKWLTSEKWEVRGNGFPTAVKSPYI